MKKLYFIILTLLLICGNAYAEDWYVYIAADDKIAIKEEDDVGLHKRGDIVDVVKADQPPSELAKKQYLIFKVKDITKAEKWELRKNWDKAVYETITEKVKKEDWENSVAAGRQSQKFGTLPKITKDNGDTVDVEYQHLIRGSFAYRKKKMNTATLTTKRRGLVEGYIDRTQLMNAITDKTQTDLDRYAWDRKVYALKQPFIKLANLIVPTATAQVAGTYTINKTGENYASFTLCESGQDGNYSGVGIVICELYADDGALDDYFAINGSYNLDASNHMEFTSATEDRHEGVYSTSKARLEPTSSGGNGIIDINDDDMVVEWLQMTIYSGCGIYVGSAADGAYINHNIIDGAGSTSNYGIYGSVGDPGFYVFRNAIYDADRDYYGCMRLGGANDVFYNNTCAYNGGQDGYAEGYRIDGIIVNNIAFQNDDNWTGTGQTGSGYNLSDTGDSTAPGSNNQNDDVGDCLTGITDGSWDMHIKSGCTSIDNGSDLGSPYDVDIDGVSITGDWDIGTDEYVSGEAGPTGWYYVISN